MKWVLVLMVFASPGFNDSSFGISVSPHPFATEKQCKAFVAALRDEHKSKRIDASCILVANNEKGGAE